LLTPTRLREWNRVKHKAMNLKNRINRLEKLCQSRSDRGAGDQGSQHDRVTGDDLLRLWEGGADDWVQARIEQIIEKCAGVSPEAQAHLQDRLKILKTGCPQEVLLVLTGLSRDCPEWCSPREGGVIEAALDGDPALAMAAAEYGILRAGRKDWRAFAGWLERRPARDSGCNLVSAGTELSPSFGLPP
jgi:hypothetical protein